MPIYTRCIQPHSIDQKLFTDREEEYRHIKAILRSIILSKEEEERRLLIHGDRGTGKSILLRKVLSHLKQEIDFKESPIIAALRSEAITVEFRRSFRESIVIKELSQNALTRILDKRMEKCPEKDLLDKKLPPIADKLKRITGNPLSFLTWIHFLCTSSELNPTTLLNDLIGFIVGSYGFDDPEKIALISTFFLKKENPFLAREEILAQSTISEGDCDVMIENGILVPDDLYKPRKHRLSPDFAFFKLEL